MIEFECDLAVFQNKKKRKPKCTFKPVKDGHIKCWHFLLDRGQISDVPAKCTRLFQKQMATRYVNLHKLS